ncbi:hypothetical protein HID58_094433 [Brassica napus]|uniref:Uncharacterized protein n=1 Tax=Brassica napus TaxID=3708 RepID=A0ABQ7X7P6_BRANA|nr:hypothetical protein HID58_094433 [Brassica napus]
MTRNLAFRASHVVPEARVLHGHRIAPLCERRCNVRDVLLNLGIIFADCNNIVTTPCSFLFSSS